MPKSTFSRAYGIHKIVLQSKCKEAVESVITLTEVNLEFGVHYFMSWNSSTVIWYNLLIEGLVELNLYQKFTLMECETYRDRIIITRQLTVETLLEKADFLEHPQTVFYHKG